MAKLTTTDIASLNNAAVNTINSNFAAVETAMENTLSRDGTSPNTMNADLDMNSNQILNLPAATTSTEPVRKAEFDENNITLEATVSTYANAAAASAAAALVSKLAAESHADRAENEAEPGTSATSVLVGTGSKSFTTQADKPFEAGRWLLIHRTSSPTTYMHGQATAYSNTSLTVNVTNSAGSGTHSDWTITVSGTQGAAGSLTGPASSTDNAVPRFSGTSGTLVKNSGVIISDADGISGVSRLDITAADNPIVTITRNGVSHVNLGDVGGTDDAYLQLYDDLGNENIRLASDARSWIKGGELELPISNGSSTLGVIYKKGTVYESQGSVQYAVDQRFLHDFNPSTPFNADGANLYIGHLSGNFTMAPNSGAIGDYNIHCAYNTGVGTQALSSLTTGYNNTGCGVNAMRSTTQGYQNTAVGRDAMENNLTGFYNAAVGQSALNSNTAGNYNTAIGGLALYTSTGDDNTALGYNAGFDNTTGDDNTYIGYNTGRGITTGSQNTIIGANVTGLSASLANNIIIADGAGTQRINIDSNGLALHSGAGIGVTGTISPSQITADENNYAPTGHATASIWRINTDTQRTITGISGGIAGRILTLINIGNFDIILGREDIGSSAENRMLFPISDSRISSAGSITLIYDGTASRWRSISHVGSVLAPSSSTDNAIVRWNGTTGKPIQNSTVIVDDSGNVSGVAALTTTGNIELGHASDTTIARSSAGNVTIEGNVIYRAGGTDVPVTDGGTGASDASTARTNLGLAIGTNVAAWDADLDAIAALSGTSVFPIRTASNTWAGREELFKVLSADANAQDVNTDQPWFPSAGGVTVATDTTYMFEGVLILDNGTSSHNTGFSLGGTAALVSVDYTALIYSTASHGTVTTTQSVVTGTSASNTPVNGASTAATTTLTVRGIVRIDTTGTLIPQFRFSAAPGGTNTVKRNSFFRLWAIGSDVVTSQGTWA